MPPPFISVIMPVYNAMPRLTKAAASVLTQSYADIELILVDDASNDGSGAECERIARADSRAHVVSLAENGGLANARNKGFEACRGTYAHFMDADDTLDRDLYARCRNVLDGLMADWVAWGVHEEYYEGGKVRTARLIETREEAFTAPAALRRKYLDMEQRTLFGYAWNKLYRTALIRERGLAFPSVPLVEDVLFNIEYAKYAASLATIGGAPYRYARNAGASLTSGYLADYFSLCEKRLDSLLALYRGWRADSPEARAALAGIYVRYLYSALARNCDPRAAMTRGTRKEWLRGRFASALYRELMPYAAPRNPLPRLMARWAARGRTRLCTAAGRAIYLVQRIFPRLFIQAKQNR
jgi:glycosyltransferase involved in cell wall biosynthesis